MFFKKMSCETWIINNKSKKKKIEIILKKNLLYGLFSGGGGGGRAGAGKQFDASSILSGLGSLFAGQAAAGGAGAANNGLDPQLVGQLVSMLAANTLQKHSQQQVDQEIESNTIDSGSDRKPQKPKQQESDGIDFESLANLASSFLPRDDQPGKGKVLVVGIGDFTNPQLKNVLYFTPF